MTRLKSGSTKISSVQIRKDDMPPMVGPFLGIRSVVDGFESSQVFTWIVRNNSSGVGDPHMEVRFLCALPASLIDTVFCISILGWTRRRSVVTVGRGPVYYGGLE